MGGRVRRRRCGNSSAELSGLSRSSQASTCPNVFEKKAGFGSVTPDLATKGTRLGFSPKPRSTVVSSKNGHPITAPKNPKAQASAQAFSFLLPLPPAFPAGRPSANQRGQGQFFAKTTVDRGFEQKQPSDHYPQKPKSPGIRPGFFFPSPAAPRLPDWQLSGCVTSPYPTAFLHSLARTQGAWVIVFTNPALWDKPLRPFSASPDTTMFDISHTK